MKVCTLSKVFFKRHPKAGMKTNFRLKYLNDAKIHTIRANVKNYYRDGDALSIREWSFKPYNSKQCEFGQVQECGVEPVRLYRGHHLADVGAGDAPVVVPIDLLARNDGLSVEDFYNWFFTPKGKNVFIGDIIYFTDFRY